MHPVPIKRDELWPGSKVITVKAPPGTEDSIKDVEAVVDTVHIAVDDRIMPAPRINMRITLTTADLDQIQKQPYFWISFLTPSIVPFQVGLLPEGVYYEEPTGGEDAV